LSFWHLEVIILSFRIEKVLVSPIKAFIDTRPASANNSFFKVGNYDVNEDKTPPLKEKINTYFYMAGLALPTDLRITLIAK